MTPSELSTKHATAARSLIDVIAEQADKPEGLDLEIAQVLALADLHAQLAIHSELDRINDALRGFE